MHLNPIQYETGAKINKEMERWRRGERLAFKAIGRKAR